MSYFKDINASIGDGANLDAFSRLRTSEPETIFDSKLIHDNAPLFWDDAQIGAGVASSTYNPNQASVTLSISSATARRVRQTYRRFNYQPGKSFLVFMTGIIGSATANVKKKIGYFDDDNGLFFEMLSTGIQVVRRTKTSGSVEDNPILQANWNLDKMDGSGPSGINLDFTKTQIFLIDFEWLGVGRVRMGFVMDGIIRYCHQIVNANYLDKVYMSTPNLPLRYEIQSTSSASDSMTCICSSAISEGGTEELGVVRTVTNDNTFILAATAGIEYPCIAIRLQTGYLGTTIKPLGLSLMGSTANDNYEWKLTLNPTGRLPSFIGLINSACEVAYGGTGMGSGYVLNAGYIKALDSVSTNINTSLNLGASITGARDILVLSCIPLGTPGGAVNLNLYSSLTFRELL